MKIKLVAFDLDGTLVNAYPAITKSFNYTMKKLGCRPQKDKIIRRAVGWGDKNLLLPFVEKKDLRRALILFRRHHAKALVRHSNLLKCACAVLCELKDRGYKLAVASNRPTKSSKILMRALKIDKCFDYVLCGDRLKEGKPHPEILNRILSHFRLKKNEMFYVGDMTVDVQAGRRAGVKTVIVLGGSSSKKEIQREKPFKVIANICGLIGIVEKYG